MALLKDRIPAGIEIAYDRRSTLDGSSSEAMTVIITQPGNVAAGQRRGR